MLQQALNRHSQIVIPPETKFFYYLVGQSWRQQVRHVERLRRDLQVDLPIPRNKLRTLEEVQGYYNLMAESYCHRIKLTPTCFGEKTPEHTSRILLIRQVFPKAKIIFIYRDGRDVALSLSKVPWLNCDVNAGIWIWQRYHRMMQHAMKDSELDCYTIRYEDIVSHPHRELSLLLDFLRLPNEVAVATGYGNREGVPQHELPWKAMALQQIVDSRMELWKRELTKLQLGELECIAGGSLQAIGYKLAAASSPGLNIALRGKLAVSLVRCGLSLPATCLINETFANVDSSPNRSRKREHARNEELSLLHAKRASASTP